MQSFKDIYSVVMKLNQFFALHFFANGLYQWNKPVEMKILYLKASVASDQGLHCFPMALSGFPSKTGLILLKIVLKSVRTTDGDSV